MKINIYVHRASTLTQLVTQPNIMYVFTVVLLGGGEGGSGAVAPGDKVDEKINILSEKF